MRPNTAGTRQVMQAVWRLAQNQSGLILEHIKPIGNASIREAREWWITRHLFERTGRRDYAASKSFQILIEESNRAVHCDGEIFGNVMIVALVRI